MIRRYLTPKLLCGGVRSGRQGHYPGNSYSGVVASGGGVGDASVRVGLERLVAMVAHVDAELFPDGLAAAGVEDLGGDRRSGLPGEQHPLRAIADQMWVF